MKEILDRCNKLLEKEADFPQFFDLLMEASKLENNNKVFAIYSVASAIREIGIKDGKRVLSNKLLKLIKNEE